MRCHKNQYRHKERGDGDGGAAEELKTGGAVGGVGVGDAEERLTGMWTFYWSALDVWRQPPFDIPPSSVTPPKAPSLPLQCGGLSR